MFILLKIFVKDFMLELVNIYYYVYCIDEKICIESKLIKKFLFINLRDS